MASGAELKDKFWDELEDSPFVMIGLTGVDDGHTQPMTAQFDDDIPNVIYFYSNKQNRLVAGMGETHKAVMSYTAKGHDLFASVHGTLTVDNDREIIEKFWSPVVGAWYENGKDDANLTLLRFDLGRGEIWRSELTDFLHYMADSLVKGSADEAAQDDVAKVTF